MSDDFAITAAAPLSPVPSGRGAGNTAPSQAASDTTTYLTAPASSPALNPGLHLDPALNLVVLQFLDSKGDVTQTIPSQKQLQAYRLDDGL